MPWTAADLPELTDRVVLVTGATSGLGEASAIALATRGARVVLATRDATRTGALMDRIRARRPTTALEHLPIDLADLASVRTAAARFAETHGHLDVLLANAGVMATPLRRTADGFELQIGVNHLGHHALIGLLLPQLVAAPAGRVVVVSSSAHRLARLDVDDLNWERRRYERWGAYGASKLANLLLVRELQARFTAAGTGAIAVGAHPGYAATALQTTGPAMQGGLRGAVTGLGSRIANVVVAQSASQGALPQLYASVAPDVTGGSYWGPDGPGEARGYPTQVGCSRAARDGALAARLTAVSEELTEVALTVRA